MYIVTLLKYDNQRTICDNSWAKYNIIKPKATYIFPKILINTNINMIVEYVMFAFNNKH